ncbi:MAG: sodium:proton antiporter [Deltaproteobacteria bacterium]|nr:sodium:proton antiporter [Deltaproteobacteria bacterium]
MYKAILFTAVLVFTFGLFSRLSDRSPITGPMIFVSMGLLLGPLGLDLFQSKLDSELVQTIATVTLVVILFTDASTINLRDLLKEYKIPLRLLFVGLPLTMGLGLLAAVPLFGGMSLWLLAMMAFILSPTDAALGQAVVNSDKVPQDIRESISVESGLNDGIALPPILACMAAVAATEGNAMDAGYWLTYALKQLTLGPIIGALVGWLGGRLVEKASDKGWMNPTFQRLVSLSLSVICYALAETLHGNGFIAAFFGGLMLGTRTTSVRERIQDFGEAEGQYLMLFVFLIFGMVMVPVASAHFTGRALLYAALSLTVIRMIPVALSLLGSRVSWGSVAFIGWFGPRGIASVLYSLMVVGQLGIKGNEQVLSVIVLTVLISVFAHGLSAVPLSALYKNKESST